MSTSPSSLLRTAVTFTSWRFTRNLRVRRREGLGDAGLQAAPAAEAAPDALDEAADDAWWRGAVRRVLGVGKPLMLGLAILATAFGLATYFVVSALWKVSVLWKRHRRLRR